MCRRRRRCMHSLMVKLHFVQHILDWNEFSKLATDFDILKWNYVKVSQHSELLVPSISQTNKTQMEVVFRKNSMHALAGRKTRTEKQFHTIFHCENAIQFSIFVHSLKWVLIIILWRINVYYLKSYSCCFKFSIMGINICRMLCVLVCSILRNV